MTCDTCAELAQIKAWLAKLLEHEGIPLGDALRLEDDTGYILLEDGSLILLEN